MCFIITPYVFLTFPILESVSWYYASYPYIVLLFHRKSNVMFRKVFIGLLTFIGGVSAQLIDGNAINVTEANDLTTPDLQNKGTGMATLGYTHVPSTCYNRENNASSWTHVMGMSKNAAMGAGLLAYFAPQVF